MLKKFKEFYETKHAPIIISKNELDDQFLRLQEIFDCYVHINIESPQIWNKNSPYGGMVYTIGVYHHGLDRDDRNKVYEEILRIKRYLENKFPASVSVGNYDEKNNFNWNPIIVSVV